MKNFKEIKQSKLLSCKPLHGLHVFLTFLLKDLDYLRNQSSRFEECNKKCDENSKSIDNLQKRVKELEWKNGQLQNWVNKFEDYSRKDNLIIKGIAETGPNENASEVAVDFFKDNLKVPEAHKIGINNAHRLGKPPHLIATKVKTPRLLDFKVVLTEQMYGNIGLILKAPILFSPRK